MGARRGRHAWQDHHDVAAGVDPRARQAVAGLPDRRRRARLRRVGAPAPTAPFFVIEADEYDTAFCDKRSKFVHYRPRTAVLNNLEYDHADIFPDLAAIETQFHHLVRTVPHRGRLIVNGGEDSLRRVLARGCWSEVERFAPGQAGASPTPVPNGPSPSTARSSSAARRRACSRLAGASGRHNQLNALAAIAAARHVGVPVATQPRRAGGVSRRQATAGTARRRRWRHRVRRFRASPDRDRDHARGDAPRPRHARAFSRCSSRVRTR